jgi:hypothetical protein
VASLFEVDVIYVCLFIKNKWITIQTLKREEGEEGRRGGEGRVGYFHYFVDHHTSNYRHTYSLPHEELHALSPQNTLQISFK